MGMYTELLLKCKIVSNPPEDVTNILNYLFNYEELDENKIPQHKLFEAPRWRQIGNYSSYSHIPWVDSKYEYEKDYLFSRSDFKNYDREIELFIDWLMPYIEAPSGTCIGWQWYETEMEPSLIFKK